MATVATAGAFSHRVGAGQTSPGGKDQRPRGQGRTPQAPPTVGTASLSSGSWYHFLFFFTLKIGTAPKGSQKRWVQIPGCFTPRPGSAEGTGWLPPSLLPGELQTPPTPRAGRMEQASEEKQSSVCSLVAVFETSRYRWWGRGPTFLFAWRFGFCTPPKLVLLLSGQHPSLSIMGDWQHMHWDTAPHPAKTCTHIPLKLGHS